MVTLHPLDETRDLDFLMELERLHHENGFIGLDSAEVHLARLRDPQNRYFLIESHGERVGFVIVCDIEPVHRNILIKRIALGQLGRGTGREALRLVVQLAFGEWNAHRLWLDVYDDNERARRTYRRLGFVEEGTLRECCWHGGRFRSLVVMSLLEADVRAQAHLADSH